VVKIASRGRFPMKNSRVAFGPIVLAAAITSPLTAQAAKKKMNEDKPPPRIRTMYAQRFEKSPVVKLGPDIKAKIGMQLRVMYGEVIDHGVPDRFVQMLKRLDDPNCEDR
jgi:hypothetical protein